MPTPPPIDAGHSSLRARSQDLFFSLTSLALSRYPARHPFQGSVASFKLCFYGNGRDVTVPLAWIIKSEGEAEGNGAQWTWLLRAPRLEEEPRGGHKSFCNWFLSEGLPFLQVPSRRHETLGLEETCQSGSMGWSRYRSPLGIRPGILVPNSA